MNFVDQSAPHEPIALCPNKKEIQKSGQPNFFHTKPKGKDEISCFDFSHSKQNLSFSYSLLSKRETQLKLMLCGVDHMKVVPLRLFLRNISAEARSSARSDICREQHP